MCGIAGVIRTDGSPARAEVVEAMLASMAHRGPDDSGLLCEGNLAMGMRRLAIIDLSPLGHQPMANRDGRIDLVFNGEIYNFQDLRSRLAALGYPFRSLSDTEVVVHGYQEFGAVEMARRLEGMFAAAIFDRRSHQLHLVRDHFGIKPLYLRHSRGQISFASELRALAVDGSGPLRPDPSFIPSYLRLGWVPSPHSAFLDVVRLDPGSIHTIDLRSGAESSQRYYDLQPASSRGMSDDDLLERLRELLHLSVRRQLVADVPVGVFLSGGLDSSAISAVAAPNIPGKLRSFSVGFGESDRGDEVSAATEVARAIGSQNTVLRVAPNDFGELEPIVAALEEPIADSAIVPLWQLCRGTAEHVTVALSGEGGDEAFGGYPRYFWGWVTSTLGPGARAMQPPLDLLSRRLPARSSGPLNLLRRATKLADSAQLPEAQRYLSWFDNFSASERASLHPGREDFAADRVEALFAKATALGLDPVQRLQYVDLQNMLLDNLLAKSDRLSMAHSLEVRVPLLDRPLLEFGLGLPISSKLGARGDKKLLRRFVAGELPRSIARKPKRGFEVPIDHWFRHGSARKYLPELPHGALVKSLGFSSAAIADLTARHAQGQDLGRKLFALLTLEIWARRYAT